MKWKPIETAPKDGTVIDIFHKVYGRFTDVWWDQEDSCWVVTGEGDSAFSHWMPVPGIPE